jgi:uncharacterized RDD family membrane protein YckC
MAMVMPMHDDKTTTAELKRNALAALIVLALVSAGAWLVMAVLI